MAEEDEKHGDAGSTDGAEEAHDGPQGGADDADDGQKDAGKKTVSLGKYDRIVSEKDAEIARLTAQLDEASKSEEGRKKLQDDIEALKSAMADEKLGYSLELAGCRNVKAAKAVLDDCGGDVGKCKEEFPYLFAETKKTDSAGRNEGTPGGGDLDALEAKLKRATGRE